VGQYFSNEELDSHIKTYQTKVFDHVFTFYTDRGVFSKDHLDFGTRLLLENIPLSLVGDTLLDVGCGYGVMGIVLSKIVGCHSTLVDVNRRALHLASMNAEVNGVTSVSVLESNCYENVSSSYHTIVTNPPIRAGKKVVYEIVMRAKDHLLPGGTLFLVIRKEQGAKSLISDLETCYHVEVLERKKGFFVLKCTF